MEISLKDTLRTLRQKKNITQEALASYLGITPQSVGKWERGEGFPDITLLPKLALYFGVTIDDLLNVGQARIEEKIGQYDIEGARYARSGDIDAEIAVYEKAYEEFPNDCRVMHSLMNALDNKPLYPPRKEDADRIIELGERILNESTDNWLREGAVQCLCLTYSAIGDPENALKYAKMGGSMHVTCEELCTSVLTGEEGVEATQRYIVNLLYGAILKATNIPLKVQCTPEAELAAYRFGIDLLRLLFPDDNVGFYASDLSWLYMQIALVYAKQHDAECTLAELENAVKYAVRTADKMPRPYTAPMVDRLTYDPSATVKNYKGNACNLRQNELGWPAFDFLREDECFKKICEKLHQYAEE